jgi:hypothetical protein
MNFWFQVTFGTENPFVVRVTPDRSGLSLMIKPYRTIGECMVNIVGYLEDIPSQDILHFLIDSHFASMFTNKILFGPLSYAENNCGSTIWFSNPSVLHTSSWLTPPYQFYKQGNKATKRVLILIVRMREDDNSNLDPETYQQTVLGKRSSTEKLMEVKYTDGQLWFDCTCSECT